ncbi:MAG: hypothetical protein PHT95_07100 [Candidatus Omnitrophica bacterium]|nr:hypothetical protein [Candidatus Omnitrophota bacterium]
MKKILIANIFGIGDVLFTTPLAASLREAYPGVTIDYLSNARTRDLVSWIPGVDNVHVMRKTPWWIFGEKTERRLSVRPGASFRR